MGRNKITETITKRFISIRIHMYERRRKTVGYIQYWLTPSMHFFHSLGNIRKGSVKI